jgi:hypothetical protein
VVGPTSYACRGPSHTTTSWECRERQALYARPSRSIERPQPVTRTGSVDRIINRFTGFLRNKRRPGRIVTLSQCLPFWTGKYVSSVKQLTQRPEIGVIAVCGSVFLERIVALRQFDARLATLLSPAIAGSPTPMLKTAPT